MTHEIKLSDGDLTGPADTRPPQPRSSGATPRPVEASALSRAAERFAGVFRRHRYVILPATLGVFAAVALFTLLWPRTYESTALIVVENDADREQDEARPRGGQVSTQAELMQSRNVVERVVDQLDLHVTVELRSEFRPWAGVRSWIASTVVGLDDPGRSDLLPIVDATRDAIPGTYRLQHRDERGVLIRDVKNDSTVATAVDGAEEDDAVWFSGVTAVPPATIPWRGIDVVVSSFDRTVERVRGNITTTRVAGDADLIELRCLGATAARAHELCSTVLENYGEVRANLQRAETNASTELRRNQLATISRRIDQAEDRLRGYRTTQPRLNLDGADSADVRQYTELRAGLEQLEAEHAALGAMTDTIRAGEGSVAAYRVIADVPSFVSNPAITERLSNLFDLETRRNRAPTASDAQDAEGMNLDDRIEEIERQLLTTAANYREALSAQIRSQESALENLTDRIPTVPGEQLTAAQLSREVTQLRDLFATLQAQLREAEQFEAVPLSSIRVVDAASFPLDPSSPNVWLALAMGLVLSMASGLLVAGYLAFTDRTVHGQSVVKGITGSPVLTMLPRISVGSSVIPLPHLRSRFATDSETSNGSNEEQDDEGTSTGLSRFRRRDRGSAQPTGAGFQVNDERRVAFDSFRSLATEIRLASHPPRSGPKVIAVTSPSKGEGKTFTTCNLGLVKAAETTRCLVIDADVRGHGVTTFFNCKSPQPGLTDLIAGDGETHDVLKAQINGTGSELWVLPGGRADLYSGSLLASPKFLLLLQRARLQFDLVVIDTPPVNSISDAMSVAAVADAVVMVVKEGFTEQHALATAVDRLQRCGATVLGTVINHSEMPGDLRGEHQYPYNLIEAPRGAETADSLDTEETEEAENTEIVGPPKPTLSETLPRRWRLSRRWSNPWRSPRDDQATEESATDNEALVSAGVAGSSEDTTDVPT